MFNNSKDKEPAPFLNRGIEGGLKLIVSLKTALLS